jgi:hypothetical protein
MSFSANSQWLIHSCLGNTSVLVFHCYKNIWGIKLKWEGVHFGLWSRVFCPLSVGWLLLGLWWGIMVGRTWWSKVITKWQLCSKERERIGLEPHDPLHGHGPSDLIFSSWVPPVNSASWWQPRLYSWAFGRHFPSTAEACIKPLKMVYKELLGTPEKLPIPLLFPHTLPYDSLPFSYFWAI